MRYTKVVATISPFTSEKAEILTALLADVGFESFMETETGLEAYILHAEFRQELLDDVKLPFDDTNVEYSISELEDKDWNEEWEKNYYQPIVIDDKCIVRSPFHPAQPEIPIEIIIEPKMSFGTGHHETTSMMIESILEINVTGHRVLDMGCGTGILAILASKRGASEILAIDIDEWCIRNSEENCQLNSTGNIIIKQGDASILSGEGMFDIIIANINRNILLADMKAYLKQLKPGGLILFSGFYESDFNVIDEEAKSLNLRLINRKEKNNWTALTYELSQ
jgi:ribosomal protein L11 methyltransferase